MKLCERTLSNNDMSIDEIRDIQTNNLRQILSEVKEEACLLARNMELLDEDTSVLVEIEEDMNGLPQANIYKNERIVTQLFIT